MGRKRSKKAKNGFVHNSNDCSPQSENHARQTTSWLQTMKDFYSENEHLGTENRTTEFKSGPGFIQYGFRENVTKYVCGFVNSRENGKLLIGVNDNGNVEGYYCTQQMEDRLRLEIDEAVKDITPPVFPKDYSVGFVPVHDEQSLRKGDLKVTEIMVQGSTIKMKDQLYCNRRGAVFMRRDGSTQELKANEVHEWIRRHYQGELDKLRNNEGNLQSDLQTKQSELRQTEEKRFVHNSNDYSPCSPQSENHARQTTSWLQTMKDFYSENEHLGTENRTTEFKSGPNFIKNGFRENVAKYVCGFVNSRENGKLLIGVNDNGNVEGYYCTQQMEDRLRLEIDEAVKDITPPVFPKDYSVGFVPVHDEQSLRKGDLKVIEIMVQGSTIEMKDQLYCNRRGAVFMRRDGSTQELKANEAQEWIRRHYQGELDKLRKNEGNLQSDLQTKQSELRQTEEKLQEKNYELDKKEFALQQQKSTMNHMSDKMREMQDDLNHMKQGVQNEAQGETTEVLESLAEMKQILKEQDTKKKGSKVCSIS